MYKRWRNHSDYITVYDAGQIFPDHIRQICSAGTLPEYISDIAIHMVLRMPRLTERLTYSAHIQFPAM